MAEINLYKYKLDSQYKRNYKTVLFDPIRKIFVQLTPEEEVRQKFIQYLIDEIKIPSDNIEVETHLAHFRNGAFGRADIIGYYLQNGIKKPLFIVECKEPRTALTEKVFNQVSKYDEIVKSAGFLFVTNGETIFQVIKNSDGSYSSLSQILKYEEMIGNKKVGNTPLFTYQFWRRPPFEKLNDTHILNNFIDNGWFGKGSNPVLFPLVANLIGLFMDSTLVPHLPMKHSRFTIIDQGLRLTEFGNAGGGSYPGEYRYFILEDSNKNNIIVSIGIKGKLLSDYEPGFGKMNGHTSFIVAIDDFDKSHNSLQLDLDINITKMDNYFEIYHNGALTVGKIGSVSPTNVLNYIYQKAPHLIKNNKIFLGSLPMNKLMDWEDANTFLLNSIEYALLRDEIRADQTHRIILKNVDKMKFVKLKHQKITNENNNIRFDSDISNKIIVKDFSYELNPNKTVKAAVLTVNISLPQKIDLIDEGKNWHRDYLRAIFYYNPSKKNEPYYLAINMYENINRKDFNKIYNEVRGILLMKVEEVTI